MEYLDFYDIAKYGSDAWRGGFSEREIADNAHNYKCEFDFSIDAKKPTFTMYNLCEILVEDMEQDAELLEDFTIDKMIRILSDAMEYINQYI